jgi:hypothetical protein
MKRLIPLILVSVFCLWTSLEAGQIYEWIDKNGVKHFTNEPPPPGSKIVNEQKAIPYNEAADQKNTQEQQRVLDQDLKQQELQTDQPEQQESQTDQPAGSQPESPAVQTDPSESDDTAEGVIADPYVRNREQVRQNERRKKEDEEIVTPLPRRNRPRERIR